MLNLLVLIALAAAPPKGDMASMRAFAARHCVACHAGPKAKGGFRADEANPRRWRAALARVEAGEMPPKGKPRPARHEVRALARWVASAAGNRVVLRRLNRAEYENTVRDLLGVVIDLKDTLPLDASSHGFDNIAEALHSSSFLLDRYLEAAADAALSVAIANAPKPKTVTLRLSLKDSRNVKIATERVYRVREDNVVLFSSSPWNAVHLYRFYPPLRGRYRFRIWASAVQSGAKPVSYRIDCGPMLMGKKNRLVGYFDAPPGKATVAEFTEYLEVRNTIRLLPYGLATAHTVHKIGADKYTGPGLAVQRVEVEGPLHDTWPPESHRRLFGDLPQAKTRGGRLEVVSKTPLADAERIFRRFLPRAYRRPVSDAEIKPFVALAARKLDEGQTFEQAVRVGLQAVLVSPGFLFLREKPGKLDGHALASRLSYFLWSSMPDEELLKDADKLHEPDVMRRQVERLLKHPKASAFTRNFVGQWLGLREIDATAPDFRLYPEFDDLLKASMIEEPRRFFDELLANDRSITNLVACDFTILNARLAKHYGIAGVEGHAFRKVTLPVGSHRGGVLTMAGVLKVTANGTSTSPVTRGAWVLDRILGSPPPPPPPGITAVEPDIRGATTIRAQLEKHRNTPSCATCHKKIDPPGFALESFDVIGGWRDHYRSVGGGKAVVVAGRRMMYSQGKPVDPSGTMEGQAFKDIDGLKAHLLADKGRLARALAGHLLTYATGAPATQAEAEAVVASMKGDGLRAMVHAVARSRAFQEK